MIKWLCHSSEPKLVFCFYFGYLSWGKLFGTRCLKKSGELALMRFCILQRKFIFVFLVTHILYVN